MQAQSAEKCAAQLKLARAAAADAKAAAEAAASGAADASKAVQQARPSSDTAACAAAQAAATAAADKATQSGLLLLVFRSLTAYQICNISDQPLVEVLCHTVSTSLQCMSCLQSLQVWPCSDQHFCS